jgi:hypothetical protein
VHDFSRLKANYAEAFPAELPNELHNAIPEYFLVVDSGAQVHVLFDTLMLAHIEDGKQRMIKWGGGRQVRAMHTYWLALWSNAGS